MVRLRYSGGSVAGTECRLDELVMANEVWARPDAALCIEEFMPFALFGRQRRGI